MNEPNRPLDMYKGERGDNVQKNVGGRQKQKKSAETAVFVEILLSSSFYLLKATAKSEIYFFYLFSLTFRQGAGAV